MKMNLKHCPCCCFPCDEYDEEIEEMDGDTIHRYQIHCGCCGLQTPWSESLDYVVGIWQTRAEKL